MSTRHGAGMLVAGMDAERAPLPFLLVAGDATGQSQGVIQAGVAGMLAGEGVARYLTGGRGLERPDPV